MNRRVPNGSARPWQRYVAGASCLALAGGLVAVKGGPADVSASSHREAPLVSGDPRADNTDVYAFVSPDAPDTVTLISNWIPFEEPNGGPNFYTWADDTRYTIKVDNDGDALADLTYVWMFDTVVRDANEQFLSNTGQVTSLTDPDLNVYQTYDLTVEREGASTLVLAGNGDGVTSPGDPISAPSIAGAASMPDFKPLRDQAIYTLAGGGKTYAGQADDPFFLDLRVFDLLYGADASEVGEDTLAGYNVNAVAIQLPKAALAINGDATRNPVVGIWSTTERRSATVADGAVPDSQFVKVSRLGNPLVNEVVVPLSLKDAFNSISPNVDASVAPVVAKVLDPILPKLIQGIYGVPAPAAPRNDLFEIFLQGVSVANAGASGDPATVLPVDLNSQDLNADAQSARGVGVGFRPSEMIRLNMAVPPTAKPNDYGVIAGDIAGFPNGRRLADDVVDIAIQVVEGAVITGKLNPGLATLDSVDRNDKPFEAKFPYLALPHVDSVNGGADRAPRSPEYIGVNPERVLDTRSGTRPAAGSTTTVQVTGVGSSLVPTDAKTVFLNITSDQASADGFVTAYPCDAPRPNASNFNPIAGTATTVLVAAKLSAAGTVCLYTSSPTHLLVDVEGYHPADAAYVSTQPVRLLDTRAGARIGYTGPAPAAGATLKVKVVGAGTPAVPADAKSVVINVTGTDSAAQGWITVYPCGEPVPNASNVNLRPGVARANLVTAKIGADGSVCLFLSQATDAIVDLQGFAPAASTFVATSPERVLDTRGSSRISYSGLKPTTGQTIELKVTGFGTTKIPANAATVALNLTSTGSDEPFGFATVYPCGSPRPTASNLNFSAFDTANMVVSKIGEGGRVCIYTAGSTHLIADINGYFADTVIG
jgi:Domain of unknown function (DUF4331)